MRKIDCPLGGWIGLPDEWMGAHAERRDEAQRKAEQTTQSDTLRAWIVALALLEDWGGVPGMDGKPEAWDMKQMSWPVMNWIAQTTLADLQTALRFPKALPGSSPVGSTKATEKATNPGRSKATA